MTLVFKFSLEKDFDLSFKFLNKCKTVELDYDRWHKPSVIEWLKQITKPEIKSKCPLTEMKMK